MIKIIRDRSQFQKSTRVPVSLTGCFMPSEKCTDLDLHKNELHSSCYSKMEYRNCWMSGSVIFWCVLEIMSHFIRSSDK